MLTKIVSLFSVSLIFLSSCASTTLIQSYPSGANLYLNDEPVGKTPYAHQDTKIVGTTTTVRLEKFGYEPLYTSFTRDEEVDIGAIIGGVFLWIPFLWTMKYKPVRTYELMPYQDQEYYEEEVQPRTITPKASTSPVLSKASKLRELKKLLDEGIITQEEFDQEKAKILAQD